MNQVPGAGHGADGPSARKQSAAPPGAHRVRDHYRIVVDVLAVPDQVPLLMDVLGTAICGRADDHDGACRVAWRMTAIGPGHEHDVPRNEGEEVRRSLEALEAWPVQRATMDLTAEVEGLASAAVGPWTVSQAGVGSGLPVDDV